MFVSQSFGKHHFTWGCKTLASLYISWSNWSSISCSILSKVELKEALKIKFIPLWLYFIRGILVFLEHGSVSQASLTKCLITSHCSCVLSSLLFSWHYRVWSGMGKSRKKLQNFCQLPLLYRNAFQIVCDGSGLVNVLRLDPARALRRRYII